MRAERVPLHSTRVETSSGYDVVNVLIVFFFFKETDTSKNDDGSIDKDNGDDNGDNNMSDNDDRFGSNEW